MSAPKTRKKRKLGSYPLLSVVFSISLALLVIGLFGLLLAQTSRLTTIIQENIEIQVYLNKGVSESETNRIRRIIASKPFVLTKSSDPQIRYISRNEAAAQFIAETGEDFSELLGENPLRDLFSINLKPSYQSLDSLQTIQKEIGAMRGVYEVTYVENLIRSINQNLTKIGLVLSGFALILLIVIVILINNTIKLALFSQRFLIRSMQLVGATSTFIKRPFLNRSLFYGALGAVIANATLLVLYQSAINKIPDLEQLYDFQSFLILSLAIILLGMFVSYLSTYRAISKYLKTSLDDLY